MEEEMIISSTANQAEKAVTVTGLHCRAVSSKLQMCHIYMSKDSLRFLLSRVSCTYIRKGKQRKKTRWVSLHIKPPGITVL